MAQSDQYRHAARTHLDGAENFLAFADWLKASGQGDATTVGWAVTALFYSAAHVMRAWIAVHHKHQIASHDDMRNAFTDYPELKKSKGDYETLKQESHSARYYLNKQFTWADFDALRKTVVRINNTWVEKTRAEIGS